MRSFPKCENELKELESLNAEQWQIDMLALNPHYVYWGPHEDYMSKEGNGWDARVIKESWSEFGPWELDDLNELVNFYFSVNRDDKECECCAGSGYGPEAKRIADDWYDFGDTGRRWCDKITQDEVDALWEAGRLRYDFNDRPSFDEVNAWQNKKGIGHDAINRWICIGSRCKRLGIEPTCKECSGSGRIFITDRAHVSLTMWFIHPRKSSSRGVEVTIINRDEVKEILLYLKNAADRNSERFGKLNAMLAVA